MKTNKEKELLIEKIKISPIIEIACKKANIARCTYYRWRQKDKRFAKKADQALKEGILLINDMAESQLLNAIRNGNMTGIIFWLKNHHGSYADKLELMDKTIKDDPKLTNEQKKLIKNALKLGGLTKEMKHEKK
jgi:hypothetical protein